MNKSELSRNNQSKIDKLIKEKEAEIKKRKDFIDYFVKRVNIYKDKRIEIVWNFGLDEFLNMRVDTP